MIEEYGLPGTSARKIAKAHWKTQGWYLLGAVILLVVYVFALWKLFQQGFPWYYFVVLTVLACLLGILLKRANQQEAAQDRAVMGAEGEDYLANILRELPDEEYAVFHNLKKEFGDIDHVVISLRHGLFLIETKAVRGKITLANGHIYLDGSKQEPNPLVQLRNSIDWLKDEYRHQFDLEPWMNCIVAYTRAQVAGGVIRHNHIIVTTADRLKEVLRDYPKNPALVSRIWDERESLATYIAEPIGDDEQIYTVDEVVQSISEIGQPVTYGAIAGVTGRDAQFVMDGRPRCPANSWVVNSQTLEPTGYRERETDSRLGNAIEKLGVIRTPRKLRRWLRKHT